MDSEEILIDEISSCQFDHSLMISPYSLLNPEGVKYAGITPTN